MTRRDQLEYVEETPIPTREYILQNWRADVVALTSSTGDLLERITYDPYGIPFATHPTDLTHGATSATAGYGTPSGVVNNDDYLYFLTLYGLGDWRADWNRDGTVDVDDHTAFYTQWSAATGSWGRGVLSNRGNILGYAGYVHEPATGAAGGGHGTMWHVRYRVLHSGLGRWIQRDPIPYADGPSLYWYGAGSPVDHVDWTGQSAEEMGSALNVPPKSTQEPRTLFPPRWWTPRKGLEDDHTRGNCWRYATCRPVAPIPTTKPVEWREVEEHQRLPGDLRRHRPGGRTRIHPISGFEFNCHPARGCFNTIAQTLTDPCVTRPVGGTCPSGSWRIAVLAGDCGDTHYVREEIDGSWTHKPGTGPARTTDCANPEMMITDPRNSNWNCRDNRPNSRNNYIFCDFLCVVACD